MNKTQNHITKFQELRTFDPKILIKNDIIYLKPFYFNYSFVMNFVSIAIFIYVLTMQNDSPTNLLCFIFLGLFIVLIITELVHYNRVQIDIKNQVITICPNIILYFVISK